MTMELNKIYNESNLDTMRRMPDNFVDLVVTSPPYDNLRDYHGYSFPFEDIAKELFRVVKEGGVVVWVVGDATINGSETGTSFRQALYFMDCGFNLHDTMIYQKQSQGARGNNKGYWQTFEYMFILSKGLPKAINLICDRKAAYGGDVGSHTDRKKDGTLSKRTVSYGEYGRRTNIWYYPTGQGHTSADEIAKGHPAVFPEALAADHIKSWSNEGDLVYDPFMGSGTTAKMAHLLNRKWIGSEISEEYVKLANKRLEPYLQQLTLF